MDCNAFGSKGKKLLKLNATKLNIIIPDINNSISSSRPTGNSIFVSEALFELFDTSLKYEL